MSLSYACACISVALIEFKAFVLWCQDFRHLKQRYF